MCGCGTTNEPCYGCSCGCEHNPKYLHAIEVSEKRRIGWVKNMETIQRVRELYDKTCLATVNGCSSDLEVFLSDLREALDGEQ